MAVQNAENEGGLGALKVMGNAAIR